MQISVIIPTYNRAHTIVNAIKSIQNQTFPVSEIIIADDASTDNTNQVLETIDDDRIKHVRLDKNKGAGGARNYGVLHASHEMIAFLDSDDVWHPDKIKKQIELKEEHENYRLIYSAYMRIMDENSGFILPDMSGSDKLSGDMLSQVLFKNTVGTPTILMEKSLFDEIGGFDEGLRSLEDWDMIIRAAKMTEFGFVPEVLVDAMYLDDGVTSNLEEYFKSRCRMMQKYRQEYLATETFNKAAENILALAYKNNVLERVQNMLLQSIST